MRLPSFLRPSNSAAIRLTTRIVGTLFIISLILAIVFFGILWTVGFVLLSQMFWTGMSVSTEKINNVFTAVEIAVSNNISEAEESINGKKDEYFAIEHLLRLNPNIMGAAIATNPDVGPYKNKRFAPYAFHDSTGIHTKTLTSDAYDYIHKEWFAKPIEMGQGLWTDPYVDEGGGNVMMITYSMPLINQQGEMYAVQTADISIDWLTQQAEQIDSIFNDDFYMGNDSDGKGNSRSFIVTKNGSFAVHPERILNSNENIQQYFKRRGASNTDSLVATILGEKNDVAFFKDTEGTRYVIFTESVQRTGWIIGTIVPIYDIVSPVNIFIKVSVLALIIGLIIVAFICRRSIHKMIKPLQHFADSADEISKGNLDTQLPDITTVDEISRLHNSFTTMQRSLINQMEQIKTSNEEKGRIEGELSIARNIQMSMLRKQFPAFPERTDIDIFALLTPAKEVGGDLYDYIIRDEKLYFCVGDVSGKGIPAAMLMMVTRALFRTAASHESIPAKIVSGINDQLVDDNESNMFVTFFLGVLDLPTGRLRYCNAGHNAPLLISEMGVEMLPCDANLPMGIMENWKFTNQEVVMLPQTTIFLYTDGLTEAENIRSEQFLEERMVKVAGHAPLQPKALVQQMDEAVHEFVGEADQNDDMTMLGIEYCKEMLEDSRLSLELTLTNDIEQVPQLAMFVDEVCESLGFDMGTTMSMNLAIEEAVVNVMSYAYPAGTVGDVRIEAKANDLRLKFIITDCGKPFDPTTQEDIDTTLSAEERHIGGLGIHLVRQIMDSINYERIDGKNVLTLRKKLS